MVMMDDMPTEYVIGRLYHTSWARNRGYVWRLVSYSGSIAVLETPKTRRRLETPLDTLRDTYATIRERERAADRPFECRYCKQPITIEDGKPTNVDGTKHRCHYGRCRHIYHDNGWEVEYCGRRIIGPSWYCDQHEDEHE